MGGQARHRKLRRALASMGGCPHAAYTQEGSRQPRSPLTQVTHSSPDTRFFFHSPLVSISVSISRHWTGTIAQARTIKAPPHPPTHTSTQLAPATQYARGEEAEITTSKIAGVTDGMTNRIGPASFAVFASLRGPENPLSSCNLSSSRPPAGLSTHASVHAPLFGLSLFHSIL